MQLCKDTRTDCLHSLPWQVTFMLPRSPVVLCPVPSKPPVDPVLSSLSSVSIQFIHFLLKLSHRTLAERNVPGHSHQGLCGRCWKPEGKRKPCHTSPTHKVGQWSGSKLPPKGWPLGPGLCPVWGLLMSALCATEPQETSALKPVSAPRCGGG